MLGFDFGTSNCAVGVMEGSSPTIVSLPDHGRLMPSTLYAPDRNIIVNWLCSRLATFEQAGFKKLRLQPLQAGQNALRELALDGIDSELAFGHHALEQYLSEPDEGYYIKSPKSFLGASGLKATQVNLFEDIVAAMMMHVKQQAELATGQTFKQTVIGRPVNFQGLKGEESNQQAINILTNAAKRVGFSDVEFQYEPVAAGFEYEANLKNETKVLVVDIGGGTTDCSMMLMGPAYCDMLDRKAQLLSHTGQRIGGNDFDIQLAFHGLMPKLGATSHLKTGKPIPTKCFWQAVAINNVNEQTAFYSAETGRFLQQLIRDAEQPMLIERLQKLYREKLSYQLVNSAEHAKIALSTSVSQQTDMRYLAEGLEQSLTLDLLKTASQSELAAITKLMQEAVSEAGCSPDVVFVTGGTAKSPVIKEAIKASIGDIEVVIGDHFGSVTAGLTRWAKRIFT